MTTFVFRLFMVILVLGMPLLLTSIQFVPAPAVHAASPKDPSVTLSYAFSANVTDVGGLPIFITYSETGFTPPLSQTWFVNGANAGTGANYTLQTNQAGNFTVVVHVSDQAGDSANSTPVTFTINPDPTATKLQVTYTPGSSQATATLLYTGGTPPFYFEWLLNGKASLTLNGSPENCSKSATCTFDLPSAGLNNISVKAQDFLGFATNTQTAQVNYQPGSGGMSLGVVTYAGIGGAAAAVLVVVFLLRKRIFVKKESVAVEASKGPPRGPVSPAGADKPGPTPKGGPPPDSGGKVVQPSSKQAAKVVPQQPVIKIVKEVAEPTPSRASDVSARQQQPPKPAYTPPVVSNVSQTQSSSAQTPQPSSKAQSRDVSPSLPQSKPESKMVSAETMQTQTAIAVAPKESRPVVQPPAPPTLPQQDASKPKTPSVTTPAQTPTATAEQVQTPPSISVSMLRRDLNQDPSDWILDCIGGYGFWSLEKGPLPKSELEKEFKKRYPNITIANFNSMVYDLIYKDKVTSEIVNGAMVLKLTKATSEEKSAEWNRRLAEAKLLEAQLEAKRQGNQPSERRKEWIEIKPQTALGDGGPFDDLNARMRQAGWYGRILTTGVKEVKSIMWHREPPVNETAPPKRYYPNIMIEWRQSGLGKGAAWHVEGVNISEDEFRKRIESKTWSEWLSKNKISVDFQTWEEAVVKVLEMGSTFVK